MSMDTTHREFLWNGVPQRSFYGSGLLAGLPCNIHENVYRQAYSINIIYFVHKFVQSMFGMVSKINRTVFSKIEIRIVQQVVLQVNVSS